MLLLTHIFEIRFHVWMPNIPGTSCHPSKVPIKKFRVRLGFAERPQRLPRPSEQASAFWLPWLSPAPCVLFSAQ